MGQDKFKRKVLARSFTAQDVPGFTGDGSGLTGISNARTAADALTAHAGGGQGAALALTKDVNRITTVATSGDSVVLPAAVAGELVIVVNSGANATQVFGLATDTVNDVAAGTGVSQMANSIEFYVCPVAGKWYVEIGTGFAGSLVTDANQDNITAFAGGGQASATQLANLINRVVTVASIGDSIKLPASAAGLDVIVINHGANAMQVFGVGTDTIDDVASGTGVTQMAGSVCLYVCTTAGKWYSNGIGTGFSGSFPTSSYSNGLVAFAGGGQANGTLLTTALNRFTTVATIGDSGKLPVAAPGMQIIVANAATNSMNLFPNTGDQINALAANAAYAIAGGKAASLYCMVAGFWHAILSA